MRDVLFFCSVMMCCLVVYGMPSEGGFAFQTASDVRYFSLNRDNRLSGKRRLF
ncbi:hypothetical protein BCD61_03370 [Neisseria meningitidis]|nr:hypothetical protein [Neisseria meningitidis]MBR7232435.1 hypothetical protein [Neisseria meningitidis]